MRKLSGVDAHFLSEETRTQHSHTIKVLIVDPAAAHRPVSFAEFKRAFEEGLSLVIPPFYWRLVSVPFRIAHPRWYYDPHLDLDYHLRRAAVPSPGGPREFAEVVSEIASTGLERDRPLWQLWYVEGLERGRIAYVAKVHHALADGAASAQLILDAFKNAPEAKIERPPEACDVAEEIPPRWKLFVEGLSDLLALIAGIPSLARRALSSKLARYRCARALGGRPPRAYTSPETRLNRKITPYRWYANVELSIDEMKRVKRAFGGTLNDVFVAATAGGIRSYLESHGELPRRSLTAIIPVSIRRPGEIRNYGNRLANWYVRLATDVDDPVERLRAIQKNNRIAREYLMAGDVELLHDFMDYWWVYDFCTNKFPRLIRRVLGRSTFNVILSNVRGPDRPMYIEGSRLVALRSIGPIVNDLGLNITAWSYVDTMSIGIVACREHVPDVWTLAEGIRESFRELFEAAERREQAA